MPDADHSALHTLTQPQPRVACMQCGILLFGRERWSLPQDGRLIEPLCHDCHARMQSAFPRIGIYARHPVPSTTVIIVGASLGWVRVLVQQRQDNGFWSFVGGAQEHGESLLACAMREAYEETGLVVEVDHCVCVDSDPTGATVLYPDGHHCQYTNITFAAHVVSGTLTPSRESMALRWVLPFEVPEPFTPSHRWRLQRFLDSGGPSVNHFPVR